MSIVHSKCFLRKHLASIFDCGWPKMQSAWQKSAHKARSETIPIDAWAPRYLFTHIEVTYGAFLLLPLVCTLRCLPHPLHPPTPTHRAFPTTGRLGEKGDGCADECCMLKIELSPQNLPLTVNLPVKLIHTGLYPPLLPAVSPFKSPNYDLKLTDVF